jgi:hypothetical protein
MLRLEQTVAFCHHRQIAPCLHQNPLSWLCWLASALRRNDQTLFYLESLGAEWLPTRGQIWLSRAGVVVATGLVSGLLLLLLGGVIFGPILGLIYGLGSGLDQIGPLTTLMIGGMILGLVGIFMELRPVETIRIGPGDISSRLPRAARVGLIFGLVSELVNLVMGSWSNQLVSAIFGQVPAAPQVVEEVPGGGLIIGLIVGLITLLYGEAVEARTSPNQGTRRSVKTALATVLTGWLVFGVVFWRFSGRDIDWTLSIGLLFALIFGLFGGGLFSLSHFVLRLVLWMNRSAPLRYVPFLEHAVERLFLRKVGGGYIFLHRMLLEYFASLSEMHRPDEDAG